MMYMQNLKKLITTGNRHQILLGFIFLIYIITNVSTPSTIAQLINTSLGTASIVILTLCLVACCNPVVAVLGIIAAYEIIRRSSAHSIILPSEVSKLAQIKKYNNFPKTLEEEMVQKLTPIQPDTHSNPTYKPVLNDIQDAAPINYEGVI